VNISNDEGDTTTQAQDQFQAEAQTSLEREINTIIEKHADDPPLQEPQDRQKVPMIGDFDGSANALWTIYGKEAKSHDDAHIHTLKDDMDGVLIFVCSSQSHPITTHAHPLASPHRLVYSPLPSPHSHSTVNRT